MDKADKYSVEDSDQCPYDQLSSWSNFLFISLLVKCDQGKFASSIIFHINITMKIQIFFPEFV